ncbi:hypothetical protein HYC85_032119 [Camellia sinensis]|uniref:NAD-dependent epimerase/dehydratase domain-containing protein n=1 Tax=Camellia sinensis TaxID=4442 RepID=A0A7J7FW89_CAMSI|nr:hypothetical protein HYC85_032119 [Camellia sinensis]
MAWELLNKGADNSLPLSLRTRIIPGGRNDMSIATLLLGEPSQDRATLDTPLQSKPEYRMSSSFQAELIEPALNGTLNVLGSCAENPTVKRVVLTSSIAAVAYNGRPRTSDVIIDETWFSDPKSCKENKLSKTLAEDAAWKFAKEKGIDKVATNPAMTINFQVITKMLSSSPTFKPYPNPNANANHLHRHHWLPPSPQLHPLLVTTTLSSITAASPAPPSNLRRKEGWGGGEMGGKKKMTEGGELGR